MISQSLSFQVNQQSYTQTCSVGTSLLSLLRHLGWVGVHRVCESGDCGSCTVWIDDIPIHSCIYPAVRVAGHHMTTIEGLAQTNQLAPMQQTFLNAQGFQCGFCTAGMIMSAAKLDCGTEGEIRSALRGNLCRCTGYQAIVESILTASDQKNNQVKASEFETTKGVVGQSIPKQDGLIIVTGAPAYTSDWSMPELLHLKVLRSPHPHAHIRRIRSDKAKALLGVHAVFTHEDVPRHAYSTAGLADPVPDPHDHCLLDSKVRFVGDRVAAVVAESPAIAEQACQLIEVEYECLPHVTDALTAMTTFGEVIHDESDSYQIHDRERNIARQVVMEHGNVEQGFAEADLLVEQTYHLPPVQHVHLEPHVSISWLEPDGTLVIRSSTQVPFHCQRVLSRLFGLDKDKIRVFKAKIGGGFGNKQEILSEDLCALATLRTGRPVQWELTRTEEFTATNTRHAMTVHLKTGVKADGTLVAQDMEVIANTGAYGNHSGGVVYLCGQFPLGLYRCSHQRFVGRAIYTNTVPAGAFRGYGVTQGTFAVESQIDEIANKLNTDPLELRLKNIIHPGDVITIGRDKQKFHLTGSYAVQECFDKVIQALGYSSKATSTTDPHLRRGIGFAVSMQGSGISKIHTAGVKLLLKAGGRYELRTGAVDIGTGSDTTLRQIAAQVLNTALTEIDLITGDTLQTPFDSGAYASGTIYISGQAVNLAAQQLRILLLETAASFLGTSSNKVKLIGQLLEAEEQKVTLQELAQVAERRQLIAEAEYAADQSSMTFAVQGVEVEVDIETGRIRVLRSVQALDLGTAINPRICHGQITGGTAMGLGYALFEELKIDEEGRISNPTLRAYRIPVAEDVPVMEAILIESTDPHGPFGAKGVGEITTNCIAPAIANAVAHATGVRLTQLPMTPERVWQRLARCNRAR